MSADWESWLEERFPGLLLPDSGLGERPLEAARRFLAEIGGRPGYLRLVALSSLFARRREALLRFAHRDLPELARRLPARSRVVRRYWEGGFSGRLDLRATLAEQLAGRRTRYVTRSRRRVFDLPEAVLARQVARRLRTGLLELRTARLLESAKWAPGLLEAERRLAQLLERSPLRELPDESVGSRHLRAGRGSRFRACRDAVDWHHWLLHGVERPSPEVLARLLAAGALEPLTKERRFELAVLLRLLEALHDHLEREEPGAWKLERGIILPQREDVASFSGPGGRRIVLRYNRAMPSRGPLDRGIDYYLGRHGRSRPDLAIRMERPGAAPRWVVVEIKHSDDGAYLRQGFVEAFAYRHEYAPYLTGWPKAILVHPKGGGPAPRPGDEVVAVGWPDWVPRNVLEGMVA